MLIHCLRMLETRAIPDTLTVETARPEHLEGIVRVYHEVSIALPELLPQHSETGFLLRGYPWHEREFAEVLSDFVLCAHADGSVLGFLLAYENPLFWRLYEQGLIRPGKALGEFFADLGAPFLFGHRIAVAPSARRRDVASHLVAAMRARIQKSAYREMYICILHGPIRNAASVRFSTRLGFEFVTERANPDGVLWGIYRLRVDTEPSFAP